MCLPYQLQHIFRNKWFTESSCYCKHLVNELNVGLNAKLSELYTTKTVDSLIHLCEHGNHHNSVDVDALDVGVAGVDVDPVALHLGYCN